MLDAFVDRITNFQSIDHSLSPTSTMSTANPKSALPRRFSQVYVEIPPSPLHRARGLSNAHTLKENAILNPSQTSPSKRKQLDGEPTTNAMTTKVKKQKLEASQATNKSDYPNGHAFCHQCNKKYDAAGQYQSTDSQVVH